MVMNVKDRCKAIGPMMDLTKWKTIKQDTSLFCFFRFVLVSKRFPGRFFLSIEKLEKLIRKLYKDCLVTL